MSIIEIPLGRYFAIIPSRGIFNAWPTSPFCPLANYDHNHNLIGEEFRGPVMQRVPFNASSFPVRSRSHSANDLQPSTLGYNNTAVGLFMGTIPPSLSPVHHLSSILESHQLMLHGIAFEHRKLGHRDRSALTRTILPNGWAGE